MTCIEVEPVTNALGAVVRAEELSPAESNALHKVVADTLSALRKMERITLQGGAPA